MTFFSDGYNLTHMTSRKAKQKSIIYIVCIWKMEQNLLALEALKYMEVHFSVPWKKKKRNKLLNKKEVSLTWK